MRAASLIYTGDADLAEIIGLSGRPPDGGTGLRDRDGAWERRRRAAIPGRRR